MGIRQNLGTSRPSLHFPYISVPTFPNFDYDDLNRIVDAYTTGTSTAQKNRGATYSIDPWGNMYNVGPYTGRVNYPPALTATATTANQLTGFGYDIAGNLVINGSASYVYDAENRITSTAGTTYRYDGDGERVVKCTGTYPSCSSATLYWSGTGSNALAEVSWTGAISNEYTYFGSRRVARRNGTGNTPFYYFADHLGSADVITDNAGTRQKESDYQPYGNEVSISGTTFLNNYKFTGKERDSESGLDNFGARYNASNLGRFMTPDWAARPTSVPYAVFGDPQSLNLYSYVRNDPISQADADGHDPAMFNGGQAACVASMCPLKPVPTSPGSGSGCATPGVLCADPPAQNTPPPSGFSLGNGTITYTDVKTNIQRNDDGTYSNTQTVNTATFSTKEGEGGKFLSGSTTTASWVVDNGKVVSGDPAGKTTSLSASGAMSIFGGSTYSGMQQSAAYFAAPGFFTMMARHPGETLERGGAAVALGACLLAPGCKEGTLGVIGAVGGTAGAAGAAGHEIYKWFTGANPD